MSHLLAINAGSSSVRFALVPIANSRTPTRSGMVDLMDASGFRLTLEGRESDALTVELLGRSVGEALLDSFEEQGVSRSVQAVGHRIVHGLQHLEPERITGALLGELHSICDYAPEHLPRQLEIIEAIRRRHPDLPQVACFDTAFHRTMPRVATCIPLSHRRETEGVQRYGFHGLSYAYLIQELASLGDPAATRGRVVLAHLGHGASLAAVRDGESIDTSMGFTPASGLPMGTRSGDLDPGVFAHLALRGGMTAAQIAWLVNHESGLLAVSGISSDMRDLLAQEPTHARAADAVELFCYQTRKWVGAFAAALGGLDTLVFAGGIGENCPSIRSRICSELGFLGVELDPARNAMAPGKISSASSRVSVRVISTDETAMIARLTLEMISPHAPGAPVPRAGVPAAVTT